MKNKAAQELGKMSWKKNKRKKKTIKKIANRSASRRKKYGYGYWEDPEVMKEIEDNGD